MQTEYLSLPAAVQGFNWMLRKIALSVKGVATYKHDRGGPGRPPKLVNLFETSLGVETKEYLLDGKPQKQKDKEGKVGGRCLR